MGMFCHQCEQAANGVACNIAGVCGKNPEVAALQNLMRIYLYHTDITDAGLFAFFGMKSLTQFTCSGTLITDTGLENLQIAIPGIKTLNFPWRYGRKSQ